MIVGIPRELRVGERRIALSPPAVRELSRSGHVVLVESGAGSSIGFDDDAYAAAGARLVTRREVWGDAELVVKVKEPIDDEPELLQPGQILFAYLHLAAAGTLAQRLCESGATAVAFETVQLPDGRLPLLAPMSEIAGKLAAQVTASLLASTGGGPGVLMGGSIGVPGATVVVLGGGTAGTASASVAAGMGAAVTVFDRDVDRLRALDTILGGRVDLRYSTTEAVEQALVAADAVIGTVLVPGDRSPRLVDRAAIGRMRVGSVAVDVSIDQGGCLETSRPTTHAEPTYVECGVVHYCVTNMPGAVARTSTAALSNALLPYVVALADGGVAGAVDARPELAAGVNVDGGRVVHPAVRGALAEPAHVS